jgi:hypothetical protein
VLAVVTFWQVRLNRTSLKLSIRPFLADPSPEFRGRQDDLLFGAPGRASFRVPRGKFFYKSGGPFYLSVAFENIGAGVAAILSAEVDPPVAGDIYVSRRFVPVRGQVRVNVAVMTDLPEGERFKDQFWAMEGVSVVVRYTDANGEQPMRSKAVIMQHATRAPYINEIAVFRDREWWQRWQWWNPRPVALGRGSY